MRKCNKTHSTIMSSFDTNYSDLFETKQNKNHWDSAGFVCFQFSGHQHLLPAGGANVAGAAMVLETWSQFECENPARVLKASESHPFLFWNWNEMHPRDIGITLDLFVLKFFIAIFFFFFIVSLCHRSRSTCVCRHLTTTTIGRTRMCRWNRSRAALACGCDAPSCSPTHRHRQQWQHTIQHHPCCRSHRHSQNRHRNAVYCNRRQTENRRRKSRRHQAHENLVHSFVDRHPNTCC